MELKAACRMHDQNIEETWRRLGFVLEMSAQAQSDYMAKSQSSMRNAKLAAETAAWNVFTAELGNDQVYHQTQVALVSAEVSKNKAALVNTLESYHRTSWQQVQD